MTEENTTSHQRLPEWLKTTPTGGPNRALVHNVLKSTGLTTVCENARCPNRCECWSNKTATFMILGDRCTRNCQFCSVSHDPPLPPAPDEPGRIAQAATELGLHYVVLTSPTRDDLDDGGAAHFADCIRALKAEIPNCKVEVLTPDFLGNTQHIDTVLQAQPDAFNHNMETCKRLSDEIRSGAHYDRSLGVLEYAANQRQNGVPIVKSGFMLGLGEKKDEISQLLSDLATAGVTHLTIGQYLAPTRQHRPVARFVTPGEFKKWRQIAMEQHHFVNVASGPFVRSSYMAEEQANTSQST
jgi:lipoic acid synthetase